MIEVENLTKRFGPIAAVQDVSFEVEKGQILGFLGPNGAGKTTTMRILAGFFPASSGRARIAGYDVFDSPLEAKRRVGYLPENPPLYNEMKVDSFLRFAATIKGVEPGRVEDRLGFVKERCGLIDQGGRLIKHLSKGFKQRVGLAQALIHDPEVLILDEPTVGLDPKQIRDVRGLIKSLGGDHTVILSTHILPEVSMTCEQVIIINDGRIAAKDTPQNLTVQVTGSDLIEIQVRSAEEAVQRFVQAVLSVEGVSGASSLALGENLYQMTVEADRSRELRPLLSRGVIKSGMDLLQIQRKTISLEDIFLEVTTEETAEVEEVA
jgi:ABC-2 type transport system ATP-binding protein